MQGHEVRKKQPGLLICRVPRGRPACRPGCLALPQAAPAGKAGRRGQGGVGAGYNFLQLLVGGGGGRRSRWDCGVGGRARRGAPVPGPPWQGPPSQLRSGGRLQRMLPYFARVLRLGNSPKPQPGANLGAKAADIALNF